MRLTGIGVRDYQRLMMKVEPHTGDVRQAMRMMLGAMPKEIGNAIPKGRGELHGANRRFPLLHPYANPIGGNAAQQARCYAFLTKTWACHMWINDILLALFFLLLLLSASL